MKTTSKVLCLLLTLAMVACLFAGCGSTAADTSAASASSAAAASEEEPAAEEETPAEAAPAAEPAASAEEASAVDDGIADMTTETVAEGAITFPLDETATFSYWFAPESDGLENLDDFNDNMIIAEAEKQTNVHIDFTSVSFMAKDEQFNLMVASGDYDDIVQGFGSSYTKGLDNAIEEDIIVDLADYLDEYAPNYSYLRNNNDEIKRSTTSDTGAIGSFYFLIGDADLGPRSGLWIRQDWLDEQGLEVPTTYDEMHDVLSAMKSAYGCSDTLLMTSLGYFSSAVLLGGYDVGTEFYNQDGTVKYGPIEEGFHEYIEMMHQWYEEGLFSSDFATREEMSLMFDSTPIVNDSCAVWNANYRGDDSWKNAAADPDFTPLAIKDMTKTGTEQIHVVGKGSNVNNFGCVVTSNCEDPETAIAWIDWWYSDDATLLNTYGIENDTFTYNEDGQPIYTEKILDNPLGNARAMRNIYTGMSLAFRVYRVVTSSYDNGYDILDRGTWNENRDNAWDISNYITKTTEEGEDYSAIMSEVETYVEESLPQFIIGDRDLSEWDTYVQDVKDMGIEEAIAIVQDCADRYNAR